MHNAYVQSNAKRILKPGKFPRMDIHERLRSARKRAGDAGPAAAAAAMGVNRITYSQHESGLRGLKPATAERYAAFFRVEPGWLLTGKGKSSRRDHVPVVGYVGAGAEVHPIDDHAKGDGLELIDADGMPADSLAVIVRGDSMYPIEDGWIIVYRRDRDGVPSSCINRLCIAKVADDGPTLIKKIRRGSEKNTYTLESWNAPPRENQRLDWAAAVTLILPR